MIRGRFPSVAKNFSAAIAIRLESVNSSSSATRCRTWSCHGADEPGLPGEPVELAPCFLGGGAGQGGVLVGVDHREQVFSAGQHLFAFDFGAEAGIGGAKW